MKLLLTFALLLSCSVFAAEKNTENSKSPRSPSSVPGEYTCMNSASAYASYVQDALNSLNCDKTKPVTGLVTGGNEVVVCCVRK